MTPDQMYESFRKAATSSWQLQQDMFKQYTQHWPAFSMPEGVADWTQFQKRWTEFGSEALSRSRESLETMYKLVTQFMELSARVAESKSPEEYRAGLEEVRVKMYDAIKDQSEARLKDFQKAAEKWFDIVAKA